MHKEGLETYNDLIKYLFCFFVHVLDRIGKLKYGFTPVMFPVDS